MFLIASYGYVPLVGFQKRPLAVGASMIPHMMVRTPNIAIASYTANTPQELG